jgi:hypothetical protein
VFWFAAHGDGETDAHVLAFDRAEFTEDAAVQFWRDGKRVGRLKGIAEANADDHEDYTVAFSIWQQWRRACSHSSAVVGRRSRPMTRSSGRPLSSKESKSTRTRTTPIDDIAWRSLLIKMRLCFQFSDAKRRRSG